MRKLRRLAVAALMPLLVTSLGACQRNGERDDVAHTDTVGLAESPDQVRELLAPVRGVALVVVEYGDLAARQAARSDVREFGQVAATDHRALVAILDSVGNQQGAALHETDRARDLAYTARMAHAGIEAVTAEAFDLAFVRAQVESHRQLLDALDQELLPAASSNRMVSLLQDTRATVDAHLTRARQLLGNLLGEPVEPPPTAAPQPQPQQPPAQQQPPPPPPDTIPLPRP